MSTLLILITLSGLLGLTSFGVGILPLSFTFSDRHMSSLSILGTGLLLGAALGVIIPEGIEALARTRTPPAELDGPSIALPLLFGFTFMLIVEQLSSSHIHEHHRMHRPVHPHAGPGEREEIFDVELAGLPDEGDGTVSPSHVHTHLRRASANGSSNGVARISGGSTVTTPPSAYPITIGLVVHGLTDGIALGASVLSNNQSTPSYGLSLVVFLALAIHKAPTSFAYTVSLMSTSLSRAECKNHLLLFSASTPVGAIASYVSFSFLGARHVEGVGIALLISAGSFLYVATVLQPVSQGHSPAADGIGTKMRISVLVLGIITPFMLGTLIDHH